jgi:diacylglycerol kinase
MLKLIFSILIAELLERAIEETISWVRTQLKKKQAHSAA